jgi:ABC-2 type transport system ATP-binding protein
MPEVDCHIPSMTAAAFVAFAGELSGMPRDEAISRSHEVLYYVGLGEARYRAVDTYSTGMKQRAKLAQALVHDPDLLSWTSPRTASTRRAAKRCWPSSPTSRAAGR